jgi:hypothetical protein
MKILFILHHLKEKKNDTTNAKFNSDDKSFSFSSSHRKSIEEDDHEK